MSFTSLLTVKTIANLNPKHSDKFKRQRKIWSFHAVVLQRTAKKWTKIELQRKCTAIFLLIKLFSLAKKNTKMEETLTWAKEFKISSISLFSFSKPNSFAQRTIAVTLLARTNRLFLIESECHTLCTDINRGQTQEHAQCTRTRSPAAKIPAPKFNWNHCRTGVTRIENWTTVINLLKWSEVLQTEGFRFNSW